MKAIKVPIKIDPGVVMYYVLIDRAIQKYAHIAKVRPTEKFFAMVQELVVNHVVHGEEAPQEIESAILNASDDMMAGREVVLRTGDYIRLMEYAREQKIV